jgi:plastocyanin
MKGVVKVLAKGKQVPTVAQDRAAASAQEAAAISQARKLAKVKPPAATVLAGNDGAGSVAWLRFFPQNLKIKAGTTVAFKAASQREVHTVTIGPAAYTMAIEKTFTTVHPNPMGPPTILLNPLAAYPSDPPPAPTFTGANHGNGFENLGILAFGGPNPSSAKVTFAKPGVFHYECVIHPGMDGTITVTS